MKVSSIISTFNSATLIIGCIEDVLNQTLYKKSDLELVFVDRGSNESEDKIIEGF